MGEEATARPGGSVVGVGRPGWEARFGRYLAAIILVALAVRVALVLALPDGQDCVNPQSPYSCPLGTTIHDGLGGDSVFYQSTAAALADGSGFINPITDEPYAQQGPLWTATLALVRLAGLDGVRQQQLLFTLAGAATVAVVGLIGRRVGSARTGIAAASIATLWPGFWLYERNLNTETISTLLVAVVILASYRLRAHPTIGRAAVLGAATGLLVLARSELVLLVPALLVPLILGSRQVALRARWLRLGVAVAVVVALLAPWTIYNLGRFERPVLLSTGLGFTARAGACDSTFTGDRLGSFDQFFCFYGSPGMAIADDSVRDGALRDEAVQYTRQHLDRLPVVVAAREGRTWGVYGLGQHVLFNQQFLNAPVWTLWFQTIALWVGLPLAVVGAVVLRRRRTLLYPLLVFPAIVVVSTAITFGDPRYRSASEVVIVVLAAVAIDAAARRWSRAAPVAEATIEAG